MMDFKQMEAPARALCKRMQRLLGEAVREFELIVPGDKVLLGLSGGKDSLALLELLGAMRKRYNYNFTVEALHVRMRNIQYESDTAYLEKMAGEWDIPLHIRETGYEADRNERRTPCFLCSWHRRKVLFAEAQAGGFGKVALGHHQDDILRTALMNLTFNGSFSTMPVRTTMRKFPVTIIRPLAKIAEAELVRWANFRQYQPVTKQCPFDARSNRTEIDRVVSELEAMNAEYRYSLWHALLKAGALT